MKRTAVALLWILGAVITSTSQPVAAPVPKHIQPPKPTKLTPQLLAGKWVYEWSGMLDGWIEFDATEDTYTAQHTPGSATVYSGTFAVSECGKHITIVEWSHDITTGTSNGPRCYRFDVDVKEWPALPGKSTHGFGFDVQQIPEANIHLKLHGRK